MKQIKLNKNNLNDFLNEREREEIVAKVYALALIINLRYDKNYDFGLVLEYYDFKEIAKTILNDYVYFATHELETTYNTIETLNAIYELDIINLFEFVEE